MLLKKVENYYLEQTIPTAENLYYCQTRDQAQARLSKWMSYFIKVGATDDDASILTAILGEICNNAFDHNLGKWNEHPGCVVAIENSQNKIRIYIADRGQGIVASLRPNLDLAFTDEQILIKAFTERISGRAPEKRGNGLKFVAKYINNATHSLVCFSQNSIFKLGVCSQALNFENFPKNYGTFFCIEWNIK